MSSITASASTLKSISSSSIFGRQKNKLESFSLSFHKMGIDWSFTWSFICTGNKTQQTNKNKTKQNENEKSKTKPKSRDQQYLVCCHAYMTLSPRHYWSSAIFFSISTLCKNWRAVWVKQPKQLSGENQKAYRTLQGYICENSRWTLSITKHRLVCVGNIYADCCREILA